MHKSVSQLVVVCMHTEACAKSKLMSDRGIRSCVSIGWQSAV